ncbi:MAG: tetratricopeptide repeat protein [Verrucomicrobiae bacterium]|nr:tetratricopeptide repeat protein [Verrucomicrobiae bacterium]
MKRTPPPTPLWQRPGVIAATLALGTTLVFAPALWCDFLRFDDPDYVTDNPWVREGLSFNSLRHAFTHTQTGNWHPITWCSHLLDAQLFGLRPWGHHLTSVLLHAANAALLFLLLQRLTRQPGRSALVALLFAWHPLRVESVAWVAERKDVLSGLFFLLALGAYVRYAEKASQAARPASKTANGTPAHKPQPSPLDPRPSTLGLILALIFFALGLMSKPMLVTLPLVLGLLDFWPLGRLGRNDAVAEVSPAAGPTRRVWLEKIPFFAIALLAGAVALWTQSRAGALAGVDVLPADARAANALSAVLIYLRKTFWPTDLAVFYPYTGGMKLPALVAAAGLLIALTFVAVQLRRRRPYLLTGWLWFLIMLLPVLGLVQAGSQALADRYTYLPHIGLGIALVWAAGEFADRAPWRRNLFAALAVALALGCAAGTLAQLRHWRNGVTLFERALAVTPDNAFARYNLGIELAAREQLEAARVQFLKAVELDPDHAGAWNNLGLCVARLGRRALAMDCYREALALKPDYPEAHFNLGLALAAEGDAAAAAEHFRAVLQQRPDFAEAHTQLGLALVRLEDFAGAAEHFRHAVRLAADATRHAHLAGALVLLHDPAGAREHYRLALQLEPDRPDILQRLAWLLATHGSPDIRNGAEALQLAERACALSPRTNALLLATLAAALAETGRYDEAVQTSEHSLQLARAEGDSAFVHAEEQRLALYRQQRPFHQP